MLHRKITHFCSVQILSTHLKIIDAVQKLFFFSKFILVIYSPREEIYSMLCNSKIYLRSNLQTNLNFLFLHAWTLIQLCKKSTLFHGFALRAHKDLFIAKMDIEHLEDRIWDSYFLTARWRHSISKKNRINLIDSSSFLERNYFLKLLK